MKICPISLVIKKMQIKIIIRWHFAPTEMTIIKAIITVAGEDIEKLETSCVVHRNVKW